MHLVPGSDDTNNDVYYLMMFWLVSFCGWGVDDAGTYPPYLWNNQRREF